MPRSLRPMTIHPITTRTLQVLRVDDVTPGMRRITLGGPELKAHTAANGYPVDEIHCDGFDDHCKVVLRHADLPADAPTPAPTQNAGVLDWPTDELAVNRSYTIRKWRPEAGEHGEMIVMPCVAAKTIMSRPPMPVVSRSRRCCAPGIEDASRGDRFSSRRNFTLAAECPGSTLCPHRPYVLPEDFGITGDLAQEILDWTSYFQRNFDTLNDDPDGRPTWKNGT